jgi:hypothetical protein
MSTRSRPLRGRGRAEQRAQVVHPVEQFQAALVGGLAILGQVDAPGGAVQQLGAQPGLQALHGQGDGGPGPAQGLGRAGEAGLFGHAHEGAHLIEGIHAALFIKTKQ